MSTNRLASVDDPSGITATLATLHRAGWSIGDTASRGEDGQLVWLVSGSNGENLIRAEGATSAAAWSRALDQARPLGMLGRSLGQATEGGDKEPLDPSTDPRFS